MNTLKDDLIKARSFIERGWTQGTYARNANGQPTLCTGPDAVAWCMGGACKIAVGYNSLFACLPLRVALGSVVKSEVPPYNDAPGRTKEEVLAVFDKAIAAAT